MEWYYAVNDERKGPVNDHEFNELVASNEITNDTLVWNNEMADWESYGQLNKELPPEIPVKKSQKTSFDEQIKNDQEEKTFGMLCHLSSFSGFLIPFGSILGPLILWLIKKNEYELVDQCGKESLNFQISIHIYSFIIAILLFIAILSELEILVIFIIPVMFIIFLVDFICVIKASVLANKGELYRYPITIRFIS